MCTNTKFIRNKYTHQKVFVECGKCPACLQKKANRLASRIRFQASDGLKHGKIQVFITLTYESYTCPFVYASDLLPCLSSDHFSDIKVYRDTKRIRKFGDIESHIQTVELGSLTLPPYSDNSTINFLSNFYLKDRNNNGYGKIGIVYYKDLQNFEKRVSSYLRYHSDGFKIDWFNASEYGPTTYRPHFHLVATVPKDRLRDFRVAVVHSWPFHNWNVSRRFQIARNVGNYVASYCNSSSVLPSFFRDLFPAKHSFSLYYGYDSDTFSYDKVSSMVRKGDLHLPIFFDKLRGSDSLRVVPAHILYRYYPKFKGISRLDTSEIFSVMRQPDNLAKYAERLEYSGDDLKVAINTIWRGRKRCRPIECLADGKAYRRCLSDISQGHRYALEWLDAWSAYRSSIQRDWYTSQQSGDLSTPVAFDNLHELRRSQFQYYGITESDIIPPNKMPWRINETKRLTEQYSRKIKQRKVSAHLYGD